MQHECFGQITQSRSSQPNTPRKILSLPVPISSPWIRQSSPTARHLPGNAARAVYSVGTQGSMPTHKCMPAPILPHQCGPEPECLWEGFTLKKMVLSCTPLVCKLHRGTMVPKPPAPMPQALSSVLPRWLLGPHLWSYSLHQGSGECSPASDSMCLLQRRATGSLVALCPTELNKESPH